MCEPDRFEPGWRISVGCVFKENVLDNFLVLLRTGSLSMAGILNTIYIRKINCE